MRVNIWVSKSKLRMLNQVYWQISIRLLQFWVDILWKSWISWMLKLIKCTTWCWILLKLPGFIKMRQLVAELQGQIFPFQYPHPALWEMSTSYSRAALHGAFLIIKTIQTIHSVSFILLNVIYRLKFFIQSYLYIFFLLQILSYWKGVIFFSWRKKITSHMQIDYIFSVISCAFFFRLLHAVSEIYFQSITRAVTAINNILNKGLQEIKK